MDRPAVVVQAVVPVALYGLTPDTSTAEVFSKPMAGVAVTMDPHTLVVATVTMAVVVVQE